MDIYWIDFSGNRSLRRSGLADGAIYEQPTHLQHSWLVVIAGTGGTLEQDTGTLLAGFEAVTSNSAFDPALEDIAIITRPDGTLHDAAPSNSASPASRVNNAGSMNKDGTYRVGNGVSAPSIIRKVDPTYSKQAAKLRAGGQVLLALTVNPDGTSREIKVVTPLGYGLDEKAIEAVHKWQFSPGMKEGRPVAVRATIEVNFRLLGDPTKPSNNWSSGPLSFKPESSVTSPSVRDGSMPKPAGDVSAENTVLEFTVDTQGAVKNVHSVYGAPSASEVMTPFLSGWKFWPARKGHTLVEATGRVLFTRGTIDQTARKMLFSGQGAHSTAPPTEVLQKISLEMLIGRYRSDPLLTPEECPRG